MLCNFQPLWGRVTASKFRLYNPTVRAMVFRQAATMLLVPGSRFKGSLLLASLAEMPNPRATLASFCGALY